MTSTTTFFSGLLEPFFLVSGFLAPGVLTSAPLGPVFFWARAPAVYPRAKSRPPITSQADARDRPEPRNAALAIARSPLKRTGCGDMEEEIAGVGPPAPCLV